MVARKPASWWAKGEVGFSIHRILTNWSTDGKVKFLSRGNIYQNAAGPREGISRFRTCRCHHPPAEKGLAMSCTVAADVTAGLIGDPTRLHQVLLNLSLVQVWISIGIQQTGC